MCGIVGYYGPKEPKDVILAGLNFAAKKPVPVEKFRRLHKAGDFTVFAEVST